MPLGDQVGAGEPVLVVHGLERLDVAAEQRLALGGAGGVNAAGVALGAEIAAGPTAVASLDLEHLPVELPDVLRGLVEDPFPGAQGDDVGKGDGPVLNKWQILCMQRRAAVSAALSAALAAGFVGVWYLQVCVAPHTLLR